MTDTKNTETDAQPGAQNAEQPQPAQLQAAPLVIHAQYIKDLSFENPHAPDSLKPGQDTPQMGVNVGLSLEKVENPNVYEVTMHIEARATRGKQVVFIAELAYAVLASVNGLSEKQHHPLLMIEAPKLAFPFARQILASVTSQGGFPPVMLGPVDFEGLYIQQYHQMQQQAQQKTAEG